MNSTNNIAIEAATDGACSGNPGNGGWGGLIILDDGSEIELGGAEKNTTNNRMELTAAIKTLERLKNFQLKKNFKLRTDSKYVIDGYSNWITKWKQNGWKTSAGKSVLNLDLWKKIDELRIPGLAMEFVKGHSGDYQNDKVDQIATSYSKGLYIEKNNNLDPFQRSLKDIAPSNIQSLYSRIELINKFANDGFYLTSNEIIDLLDIKDNLSLKNFQQFEWRNWVISPHNNQYWKITYKNNNIEKI